MNGLQHKLSIITKQSGHKQHKTVNTDQLLTLNMNHLSQLICPVVVYPLRDFN